jgi:hypothetical protein
MTRVADRILDALEAALGLQHGDPAARLGAAASRIQAAADAKAAATFPPECDGCPRRRPLPTLDRDLFIRAAAVDANRATLWLDLRLSAAKLIVHTEGPCRAARRAGRMGTSSDACTTAQSVGLADFAVEDQERARLELEAGTMPRDATDRLDRGRAAAVFGEYKATTDEALRGERGTSDAR